MTAPLGGPVDGSALAGASPFTLVGGDAALCEGDACALPYPAPSRDIESPTPVATDAEA